MINEPAPLPSQLRASFGKVGVIPDDAVPEPRLLFPQNTQQAMGTIAAATFVGLQNHVEPASEKPRDVAAKIFFDLLASSATGVIGGLLVGVPPDELHKAETAIRKALQEEPLERGLQSTVYQMAGERRRKNLVPIPDSQAAMLNSQSPTNRNYRILAASGVDSVLLVRMANHRFEAREGINPPMTFAVEANIYVVRVADGALLASSALDYRSRERTFTDWGHHNAKHLRAELRHARNLFSELLLEQYFGGLVMP